MAKPVAKKSAAAAANKKKVTAAPKKSAAAASKKKPVAKKAAKKETKKKTTTATKKTPVANKKSTATAPAKAKKPVAAAPKKSAKTTKNTAAATAAVAAAPKKKVDTNQSIIDLFATLAAYELKAGEGFKSTAYKKAAAAIKQWVKQGNTVTCGNDIAKLAGVGKATASKTDEFLKSGKVTRLEDLKSQIGDIPSNLIVSMGGSAPDAPAASTTSKSKSAAGKTSGKSAAAASSGANGGKSCPKSDVLDATTMQKIADEQANLLKLSNDELKKLARLNNQKVSGTKPELVERLGHQVVLGAVVRCPTCGGGKLEFTAVNGKYKCRGFYDDSDYVPCSATFNHTTDGSLLRQPWVAA